jgi:hypothetical protein
MLDDAEQVHTRNVNGRFGRFTFKLFVMLSCRGWRRLALSTNA